MSEIELVVLGLVNEQPRHGYEIEELIEERGIREWTNIAFSSIYYVLKRLDKAGLVTWELKEANRGSAKKVFSISKKGKTALKENIVDILSTPKFGRSILLGLANLPVLTNNEVITSLENYRSELSSKLVDLNAKAEHNQKMPFFVNAMFDHSIATIKSELFWLDKFLTTLNSVEQNTGAKRCCQ